MKKIIAIIVISALSSISFAQTKVDETISSKYLNDKLKYTIWLPKDWSAKQKYTTIYTFSYGASDAKFIAEQIDYLKRLHISNLPPIIVVNIWADMNLIGYNYETGQLTERGNQTINSIKNEIIPRVEQKYSASKFRTYIGQSYGATYGNYLFLNQPDVFSGYILMSPERIAPLQPPFEITPDLEKFYRNRYTYYFIASGFLDLQRRQDYAKDVSGKISKLDSLKFMYRYENFSIAGHNNSLAIGLPKALDFIYQKYPFIPDIDTTKTVLSLIKDYEKRLSDIYGIGIDKSSFHIYNNILPIIWRNKDKKGLIDAINYFITSESDIRQLRDFAYSCSIVGMNDKANELYNMAISKGLANQDSDSFIPSFLITCYREKAAIAKTPEESWNLLQDALAISLKFKSHIYNDYYPSIYYYLGKFAAESNYKVKEGINYLELYKAKREDEININQFPLENIYYYLGKCHFLLKDEKTSKHYFKKAIEINPEHKLTKKMLEPQE